MFKLLLELILLFDYMLLRNAEVAFTAISAALATLSPKDLALDDDAYEIVSESSLFLLYSTI
jgi:hypothetical protein